MYSVLTKLTWIFIQLANSCWSCGPATDAARLSGHVNASAIILPAVLMLGDNADTKTFAPAVPVANQPNAPISLPRQQYARAAAANKNNATVETEDNDETQRKPMPTDLDDGITASQEFSPWWVESLVTRLRDSQQHREIDLDTLIISALQNSPKIKVFSSQPVVAETQTIQERAQFDPRAFMETKWSALNNPVGNRLTTGGPPFLKDNIWNLETGVRRQNQIGGKVDLSQQLGFQNSNSQFFTPQNQGTARLALKYTQPLLNGAGRMVNTSQIMIAEINQDIVWDDFSRELQDHLFRITKAYWDLCFQREVLLQRYRNYERALEIYRQLEGRAEFDTVAGQLARARVAVLARKLEVRELQAEVLNAETKIRELVRDPGLGQLGVGDGVELVPKQLPLITKNSNEISDLVTTAMESRPEIDQAMRQIRSASVGLQVAQNELLPMLSLVLETYVAGLKGDSGVVSAFGQQFGVTPGYSTGIVWEYPWRNRAAYAQLTRQRVQVRQLTEQMAEVVGKIVAEVEVANRDVTTAYANFQNAVATVQSAIADVEYTQKRWENFAFLENAEAGTPNALLEQLLDSQQRLSDAEVGFSTAVRNYMNARAALSLADGSILQQENIQSQIINVDGIPEINIQSAKSR